MIEEDRVKAHGEMGIINFRKDVVTLEQKFKPLNPYQPGANQPGAIQPSPILDAPHPVPKISSKMGREAIYLEQRPNDPRVP